MKDLDSDGVSLFPIELKIVIVMSIILLFINYKFTKQQGLGNGKYLPNNSFNKKSNISLDI